MNCKQLRGRIDDFNQVSAECAAHLKTCGRCRRWLDDMRAISGTVARMPRLPPRPAFAARVRSRLTRQRLPWWRRIIQPLDSHGLMEVFAAGAAVASMAVALLYHGFAPGAVLQDMWTAGLDQLTARVGRVLGLVALPDLIWDTSNRAVLFPLLRWAVVVTCGGAIAVHAVLNRRGQWKESR